MTIKYSVIIPVYNSSAYLEQCLSSVLSDLRKDLEIIAIDDGSTDDSFFILNKWKEKDSRVNVFTQENAGVSAARNKGLENAKGEWVLFLDADDYFIHSPFGTLDQIIQKYKNCKLYCCNSFYEKELSIANSREDLILATLGIKKEKNLYSKIDWLPNVFCKVYSVNIFRENNIYFDLDLVMGEDMFLNIEIENKVDKIVFFKDKFYFYRDQNESATRSFNLKIPQKDIVFQEKLKQFCVKNNLNQVRSIGCKACALGGILVSCRNCFYRYPISRYQDSKKAFAIFMENSVYQKALDQLGNYENYNALQKITLWCAKNKVYFPGYIINKIVWKLRCAVKQIAPKVDN